jgi:hypothetical protein
VAQLSTLGHITRMVILIVILPVLLVAAVAYYFTSLLCRFARWRRWRVSWHFGLLGAAAAGISAASVVWLGLSLQPGSWGKVDMTSGLYWLCIIGGALGVIPSEIVVWYYRKRFRNENHVA